MPALKPPFLTVTRDTMIDRNSLHPPINPAVALAEFTCLAVSGCNPDCNDQMSTPPATDPITLYPTVRIQTAAPTAADFIEDTELGTLLSATVSGQQLTLYTFANDTAGTSNCQIAADS